MLPYREPFGTVIIKSRRLVDIALLIARLLLAAVFVTAGLAKLFDLAGSRQALVNFGVPDRLANPLGLLLPLGELIVALALIPRSTAWWGALGAIALLILFVVGIAVNLVRGNAPDCHCFGQLHSAPAGWPTLVRNGLFAAIAGFVVWQGRTDPGLGVVGWADTLPTAERWSLLVASVALAGVIGEAWLVIQLLKQNGRVLLQLDSLDAGLPAGDPLTPNVVVRPLETGLPVGIPAPTFSLPDLLGETVTLARLCASGKRVLLIFSDPACRPCNALLPEIGRWRVEYPDLIVALITRGTREANLTKATEHGLSHVLLQQGNEVAGTYGAQGTPSAVLVQSDGLVASPLAGGASAIRILVAQSADMPRVSRRLDPRANSERSNGHELTLVPALPWASLLGTMAPPLRLPDTTGQVFDLADLRGKNMLLLFWNPTCGFCQRMLADLKTWESTSPADAPQLVIVSRGGVATNAALGLTSPVLLDEGSTTGQMFGARGTPAAILIDAEGNISSPAVVGAVAIWELAGKSRSAAPMSASNGSDQQSPTPTTGMVQEEAISG